GITEGDLIVKMNGENVTAANADNALNKLIGEEGEKVSVVIRREAEDLEEMTLTYRSIEIPTVSYTMIVSDLGYISISAFMKNTPEQFSDALTKLLKLGADAVIFDVRNTSTGSVESVGDILDKLLPEGDVLFSVYKDGKTERLIKSGTTEYDITMAILVNENSSETAEIFAQALKDANKGKVIGKKTAGKGTIQEFIPLDDGGAILLTTAVYSLAKSGSFNVAGVVPNYDVELTGAIAEDMEELGNTGDDQLQKAITEIEGELRAKNAAENSEISESSELSENSEVSEPSESETSDAEENSDISIQ
ncbi:MAG: hypothetical protein J5874_05365, partial [Oscillospiraceae bacterium]|nr:hypothetical protein [Oscillospiraceae bacterium]